MLDKGLGDFHGPDHVDPKNMLPISKLGVAKTTRRQALVGKIHMAHGAGRIKQHIDSGIPKHLGQRVDGGVVGHVQRMARQLTCPTQCPKLR